MTQYIAGRLVFMDGSTPVEDTFYNGQYVGLSTGDVQVDRLSDTRRTLSAQLIIHDAVGLAMVDPISHLEIIAYRGRYYDGAWHWKQQGVFRITSRSLSGGGNLPTTSITAMDRSNLIRENVFNTAYRIAGAVKYTTAFEALITDRASGFTPVFNTVDKVDVTPGTIVYTDSDDPWASAMKLAEAVGHETYFDVMGITQFVPILSVTEQAPVLDLTEGVAGVSMGEINVDTTLSEIYNGVICRSEAPWLLFPVFAEVWDTEPGSPTYYLTWGKRPKKISDALASTTVQCAAIAQAEYNRVAGIPDDISFGLDPDVEDLTEGQVISIFQPSLGLNGLAVVDSLTIPLIPDTSLTGSVRMKR